MIPDLLHDVAFCIRRSLQLGLSGEGHDIGLPDDHEFSVQIIRYNQKTDAVAEEVAFIDAFANLPPSTRVKQDGSPAEATWATVDFRQTVSPKEDSGSSALFMSREAVGRLRARTKEFQSFEYAACDQFQGARAGAGGFGTAGIVDAPIDVTGACFANVSHFYTPNHVHVHGHHIDCPDEKRPKTSSGVRIAKEVIYGTWSQKSKQVAAKGQVPLHGAYLGMPKRSASKALLSLGKVENLIDDSTKQSGELFYVRPS
jgi:hypothetical protein